MGVVYDEQLCGEHGGEVTDGVGEGLGKPYPSESMVRSVIKRSSTSNKDKQKFIDKDMNSITMAEEGVMDLIKKIDWRVEIEVSSSRVKPQQTGLKMKNIETERAETITETCHSPSKRIRQYREQKPGGRESYVKVGGVAPRTGQNL